MIATLLQEGTELGLWLAWVTEKATGQQSGGFLSPQTCQVSETGRGWRRPVLPHRRDWLAFTDVGQADGLSEQSAGCLPARCHAAVVFPIPGGSNLSLLLPQIQQCTYRPCYIKELDFCTAAISRWWAACPPHSSTYFIGTPQCFGISMLSVWPSHGQ